MLRVFHICLPSANLEEALAEGSRASSASLEEALAEDSRASSARAEVDSLLLNILQYFFVFYYQ